MGPGLGREGVWVCSGVSRAAEQLSCSPLLCTPLLPELPHSEALQEGLGPIKGHTE